MNSNIKFTKYFNIFSCYWSNSVFVQHILLHISSWLIGVRLVHSWAALSTSRLFCLVAISVGMGKNTRKTLCFDVGKIGICHCAAVLEMQVQKLCTTLDLGLLYILTFGTYSKFARKNNFLALGVCFPHLCSSRRWPQDYRVKITFRKLPANRFVSTTKRSMKYVVNWIPLRIRVRSRNTQPHLKDSKIMLHIE